MNIGTLELQLMADVARLRSDMDQAKSVVNSAMESINSAVGMAMKALAALGIAASLNAFKDMVMGAIEAQAELKRLSERTGTTVETLSGLKGIAKLSGTSMDDVATGVQKLSKSMIAAQDGTGKQALAFKALGISGKELSAAMNDPGQMMLVVAKHLSEFKDGAAKTAVMMELFGKAGANLLPMMRDLAEKGQLNAKVTKEQADAADKFEKLMIQWNSRWKELYGTIATEILPALNEFMGALVKGGGVARTFTDVVKDLAKSGRIREWAEDTRKAIEALMSAIVPAAKIAAAYFAVFVAAPAVFSAVGTAVMAAVGPLAIFAMNVVIGQTTAITFSSAWAAANTTLFGTAVAANTAAGGLFTLKTAGAALFAAFAGWQIGSWLRDNFVEARVAGLAFVGAMLIGWENFKYGSQLAWEGVKHAFESVISTIKVGFGNYLSIIANGLKLIGANSAAASIDEFAQSLLKAGASQQTFAERTAGLTAAHKEEINSIDDSITGLVQWELKNGDASKATDKTAEATRNGGKELKGFGDASANAAKEIENFVKNLDKEMDSLALGETLMKLNQAALLGITGKTLDHVKAKLAEIAAYKDGMKEAEKRISQIEKERDGISEYFVKQQEGYNAAVKSSKDALAAAQDEYDQYGLSKSQIAEITLAKLEDARASYTQGSAGYEAITKQIEQQQQLIEVLRKGEARNAFMDLWHDVDRVAEDTFVNIFKSGKDAFEKLRDSLKDTLLRLLYQMTVQKWVFNIVASITGGMASGAANAAGSSLMGSMLGSAGTGAMGGIGSAFWNGASAGGLGGIGNVAGQIGSYGSALFGGSTLPVSTGAFGTGWVSAEGGAAIGSAAGDSFIATIAANPGTWAVAGLIIGGAIISSLLDDGPEQDTFLQFGNNNTKGVNINQRGVDTSKNYDGPHATTPFGTFGVTGTFWMDVMQGQNAQKYQSFLAGVTASDKRINSYLTDSEREGVKTSLAKDTYTVHTGPEGSDPSAQFGEVFKQRMMSILSGIEPGLESLIKDFTGTSEQLQTEVETLLDIRKNLGALSKVFGEPVTLKGMSDAFESLRQDGETTGQVIVRMGKEFDATNAIATMLGKDSSTAFGKAGLASAEARDALVNLAGGLDALNAETASFYQNFYTDAERSQMSVTQANTKLNETFGQLGIAVPNSTEEFRALVASQDLSTESGRQTYQTLMQVSGAFVTVHGTAQQVAAAEEKTANLRISLVEAQGFASAALAEKRKLELAAMTAEDAAIQKQIYAAQDAAKTRNLEIQIMELSGDHAGAVAAQRQIELNALSDSDKVLQQRIYDLQDEQAAAQKAAEAARQLASNMESFAGAMDKLSGTNAYSTQQHKLTASNSMADVTKAMPWITSLDQLMTMTADDFAQYSDANQQLILTALRAAGVVKDDFNSAIQQTAQEAAAAAAKQKDLADYIEQNFYTPQEQQAHKLSAANDLLSTALGPNVDYINMSYEGFLALLPTLGLSAEDAKALAQAFITVHGSATDAANATNKLGQALANLGSSIGDVWDQAAAQFNDAMKQVEDSIKTISGGDYSKELSSTAAYVQTMLANLQAQQAIVHARHSDNLNVDEVVAIDQKVKLAQDKLASLGADLARYTILEAQYKGHGKDLLDLEKWYKDQQELLAKNQDALVLLQQAYEQKRQDIINGTVSQGLDETAKNLRKWLDAMKLNSELSPLTAQQQLEAARQQYQIAWAAKDYANITQYAEAYLNAQKAVSGFAGDYTAVWQTIMDQIGSVAAPAEQPSADVAPIVAAQNATTNAITDMKATAAKLLEQLIQKVDEHMTQTVAATNNASNQTSSAISKTVALTEKA